MRHAIAIAIIAVAVSMLFVGCAKEEEAPPPPAPPPDPGWPKLSLQDAAVEYDLEEGHYHIRKARYEAPDSYGSEYDMALAMGHVQWAYEMQPGSDAATEAADHLILEHGSTFDAPYGYVPRCKWCGCPMPKSLLYWPKEGGEKVVECPRCGARDSFPTGLVLVCPNCHEVVAGTAAAGARCPKCGRRWRALRKKCSDCELEVSVMKRQGQKCPRCKAKWNFDTPFGNWDTRAPIPVEFTGEGEGEPCESRSTVTGFPCPNKTKREAGEDGKVRCWVHRHQGERDEVAAAGPAVAPSPAAAPARGAPGAMPGGMPGEMPGGMPGGMPGEMPGGMPGGMPPGGPEAGMAPGGAPPGGGPGAP